MESAGANTALVPRALAGGLKFPEGPRWRDGKLYFTDVFNATVHTVDDEGNVELLAEVPHRPAGLGFTPDDELLVTSMRDQRIYRIEDGGRLDEHADLSRHALYDINDMVIDEQGRAYVGSFGYDALGGADPAPGNVVKVERDGTVSVVAEDLMFPNGIVISDDRRTLAVAQTHGEEVTAFAIAEDGTLSGRRVWASLPGRFPDGMCFDADGALWVASAYTGEALRVQDGGRITHRVKTFEPWLLAVMLGGEDRQTLYLCTVDTDDERIKRGDMIGGLSTVHVEVPGAGRP